MNKQKLNSEFENKEFTTMKNLISRTLVGAVLVLTISLWIAQNPLTGGSKFFGTQEAIAAMSSLIYEDNFNGANDTTSLKNRGYKVYYRGGGPQGIVPTWSQGNTSYFNSYEGDSTGYVSCNYRVVYAINNIDSWLVTPRMNIITGDTLSFYCKSVDGSPYPDSFRVMYSASGDSVPEASWTELGRFKASTAGWVRKAYNAPSPGTGARFAIRYNIVNGGGANGNYSGIDLLRVTSGGAPPCTYSWLNYVSVKDNGTTRDTLRFGMSPAGTDGIDACLGEYPLPPAPPTGAFDSRFVLPNSDASRFDFRSEVLLNISWRITFQPSGSGYPFTFTWNPASFPAFGNFYLKDEISGIIVNINMRNQSSYTLSNTGITSLKIEYARFSNSSVSVNSDWNIVSVPLSLANMQYNSVFPGVASLAYTYNSGYISENILRNAVGYWMKFNSSANFNLTGTIVAPEQIPVANGWNLVGPLEKNIPVSAILSSPPAIISSSFFGYQGGYIVTDTLRVGKGYWIKSSAAGFLYRAGADEPVISSVSQKSEQGIELNFESGQSGSVSLYVSRTAGESDYSLPPVPPAGIFDVRFGTDKYVETVGGNHLIKINSEDAVIISLRNSEGKSFILRDAVNGSIFTAELREGERIEIPSNLESIIIETGASVPSDFSLEQNFPNPFNPSTSIGFNLPSDAKVRITVFDALGREVSVILDEFRPAGSYKVSMDASALSSGVYYYKMKAGQFEALRKMVVVK